MKLDRTVGSRTRTLKKDNVRVARRARWGWIVAALVLAAVPSLSRAQVEAISPLFVVVERENVPIQCRVGSASYPVTVVKTGQVLKADGQTASMYRVEYPAGMSAFVKVEEASLQTDGKSVALNKPSRLMAPNSEGGVSWWYLLEKELDAGTNLRLQKTVKGPDGKEAGYLVPAPAGSKGYIRRDYVRTATQAEIDRFLGKSDEPVQPAETPKPAETPSDAPKPSDAPRAPETAPAVPPVTPDPNAPGAATIQVKPAPTTNPPGAETPAGTPPREGEGQPVEIVMPSATTPPAGEEEPAAAAPASRLKAVDAATLTKLFNDARTAPIDTVEFDAVIAEFERAIDALPDDASTPRLRSQLEQRVTFLKLRSELQASLRQSVASSDALKRQADQMKDELRRLEGLRQYTVVGRLVASSVYDGRTLPLMYRVLSPEPTSTRTLAYVAPEANSDLVDKVGKLVGVVGESRFDESLRVNIVEPTRIELLGAVGETRRTPEPSVTPPPSPSPSPAPAPLPSSSPPAPATPPATEGTPDSSPDVNK